MLSCIVILLSAILLAIPMGEWCKKVMNQEIPFIQRSEHKILKFLHISSREMNWKQYFASILVFSLLSFIVLFLILLANGMESWMAFNTTCSFITNTNWQSYDPQTSLNWITQAAGMSVQNFISAAIGICVVFVLIRGLIKKETSALGNFWQDLIGCLVYILLPLNLVAALILGAQGVPMNLENQASSALLEAVAIDSSGQLLEDATIQEDIVYLDGQEVKDATILTQQNIPSGLAASQIAIKQSGTNGGGISAANAANPYENPTPLTNIVENVLILLLPMALCFSFGFMIKNNKQGWAIFAAMLILFVLALISGMIPEMQAMNMEGKEARFGIAQSAFWSISTTAASNGSVNSALNSMTPMSSMICMILMQVGEVVFGGVGSGLYGMIAFIVLSVFIAGLMVGRTPEFLQKKIEPYEMKRALILCLATPVCILLGSALFSLCPPAGIEQGAHGFSQILYAFTSQGANNGSAMGGFVMSEALFNGVGGVIMLLARYVPIFATLAMAGSLGMKKKVALSAGVLKTDSSLFVFLLIVVVLLIGALSFFPALALGPIAQFLG